MTSIKTRLIAITAALFLALFLLQVITAYLYLQNKSVETIESEQFERTRRMANKIDQVLNQDLAALSAVSEVLPIQSLKDRDALQPWLDDRKGLATIFDHGLMILDPHGSVIVDNRPTQHAQSSDFSLFPFVLNTRLHHQTQISQPYRDLTNHHPIITMSAPVLNADHQLVALLCGNLGLLEKNILTPLVTDNQNQHSYYVLLDQNSTILMHPDQQQVFQKIPVGSVPLLDRIMNGIDGSGTFQPQQGELMLASFTHLAVHDWVVGALMPMKDAQAGARRLKNTFFLLLGGSTLTMMMTMMLLVKRTLAPLIHFTRHIQLIDQQGAARRRYHYPHTDEIGSLVEAFNTMIAQSDKTRQALIDSKRELAEAQQLAQVGNWLWDLEANHVRWSDEMYRLFEVRPSTWRKDLRCFYRKIAPRDRIHFKRSLKQALQQQTPQTILYQINQGRAKRHIQQRVRVMQESPHHPLKMLGTVQDITERVQTQQRLEELATRDPLTQLYNRRTFLEFFRDLLYQVERKQRQLSLIMIDLDHFKQINDTHGHLCGDAVLRQVSACLVENMRNADICGRFGGEEFCLLLPDTDRIGAEHFAEKLRSAIAALPVQTLQLPEQCSRPLKVTASFGLACWQPGWSCDRLLHEADTALYEAKRSGRNKVVSA